MADPGETPAANDSIAHSLGTLAMKSLRETAAASRTGMPVAARTDVRAALLSLEPKLEINPTDERNPTGFAYRGQDSPGSSFTTSVERPRFFTSSRNASAVPESAGEVP